MKLVQVVGLLVACGISMSLQGCGSSSNSPPSPPPLPPPEPEPPAPPPAPPGPVMTQFCSPQASTCYAEFYNDRKYPSCAGSLLCDQIDLFCDPLTQTCVAVMDSCIPPPLCDAANNEICSPYNKGCMQLDAVESPSQHCDMNMTIDHECDHNKEHPDCDLTTGVCGKLTGKACESPCSNSEHPVPDWALNQVCSPDSKNPNLGTCYQETHDEQGNHASCASSKTCKSNELCDPLTKTCVVPKDSCTPPPQCDAKNNEICSPSPQQLGCVQVDTNLESPSRLCDMQAPSRMACAKNKEYPLCDSSTGVCVKLAGKACKPPCQSSSSQDLLAV